MLGPAPDVGKPPSSVVVAEWARPLMVVGAEPEKIEKQIDTQKMMKEIG